MHLILLPGNSKSNKDWIEEVESELIDLFDSSHVHYYKNWEYDEEDIHFEKELKRLSNIVNDYDEYVVFAKSAGTLLSLMGIQRKILLPKHCIFVGTAVDWGKKQGLDIEWLMENHSVPTLFIHKTMDPVISHSALSNMLKTLLVKEYSLVELPGDNHNYEDVRELKRLIEAYIREYIKS